MVVADKASGDSLTDTDVDGITGNLGFVESGCNIYENSTPSMTINVASGVIWIQKKRVAISSTTKTLSTADATNERIDLIVVGSDGTVDIVAGTPGASPATPDTFPSHIALARISVPASDTTITDDQITDLRRLPRDLRAGSVASADGSTTSTSAVDLDTYTVEFPKSYHDVYLIYFSVNANTQAGTLTVEFDSTVMATVSVSANQIRHGKILIQASGENPTTATYTLLTYHDDVSTFTSNSESDSKVIKTIGNVKLRGSVTSGGTLNWSWNLVRIRGVD